MLLHTPESLVSVLNTIVEIAVVVDLQASHFRLDLLADLLGNCHRLRASRCNLVLIIAGFDECEYAPVVFIDIKAFGFQTLETTVELAPILGEIGLDFCGGVRF